MMMLGLNQLNDQNKYNIKNTILFVFCIIGIIVLITLFYKHNLNNRTNFAVGESIIIKDNKERVIIVNHCNQSDTFRIYSDFEQLKLNIK